MSFTAFSKDFTANMFTCVENQFITKYLPQVDGNAVRVYLYGLYLCSCKVETDAEALAKLLKLPYQKLLEIFDFWEECDLVHVLSRSPLMVEYLPVNAAVGKPKPLRPEKYAEFNRELLRRLSKIGKDLKPYEIQHILEFLENQPMEQQAFLLIVEYCIKKDGEKVTANHILNKAKKLCEGHKFTYEQVELELNDFNKHERTLTKLFSSLGIYRKPQEADYDFLEGWLARGMEVDGIVACAEALKKGTLASLGLLLTELDEKGIRTAAEIGDYLARRQERTDIVYKVARKLGVKIQNPRAYIENYAEKWLEHGYDEESLLLLAGQAFKLGYGFEELDALLDSLYRSGIVDEAGVKEYCAARDRQLRLLHQVQAACGMIKRTGSALDMVATWQSWNFSDAMILEAAKRSVGVAAPLPYMNKLLSEWKRTGIFTPSEIPERPTNLPSKADYRNEAAIAADKRAERERYYAALHRRAMDRAEETRAEAEKDEEFFNADRAIKKTEIALAKAEVFAPDTVPSILEKLESHKMARTRALTRLNLTEEDLQPKYHCSKCSDTGFLPSGKACDCYPNE